MTEAGTMRPNIVPIGAPTAVFRPIKKNNKIIIFLGQCNVHHNLTWWNARSFVKDMITHCKLYTTSLFLQLSVRNRIFYRIVFVVYSEYKRGISHHLATLRLYVSSKILADLVLSTTDFYFLALLTYFLHTKHIHMLLNERP